MNGARFDMSAISKTPSVVYWLGDNLYLNITNQCPNNCYFCLKKYRDGINGFNLKLHKEPTVQEIVKEVQKRLNQKNWREIVFCGFGEPLTRLDCVLEVTKHVKKHHAFKIRVNTNGQAQLINKNREVVTELKQAGVEKVSVSLNAPNGQIYDQVCKPRFENAFSEVLNFIKKAGEKMDTEITTVTIPEVDVPKVREIAANMSVRFRIREYTPCCW